MKKILIAANIIQKDAVMRVSYARAVQAAGGLAAFAEAENTVQAALYAETFDALLLPGGGDLPAELFGQAPHPSIACDSSARDLSDRLLWDAFHAAGKRVLGICRGCQAVNVFCGGTLHQHLPDAFDPVLWHCSNAWGRHPVHVEESSALARVFGGGERSCNSSHHQAVDRPGEGLRVSACAPDGVIEALEGVNTLLVQFHPELMGAEGLGIFRWLTEEPEGTARRLPDFSSENISKI